MSMASTRGLTRAHHHVILRTFGNNMGSAVSSKTIEPGTSQTLNRTRAFLATDVISTFGVDLLKLHRTTHVVLALHMYLDNMKE